jgi:predicted RecA/RadA family phage recombinase
MKNFVQCGESLEFTAPAGGVVSGNAYVIGSLLVVAAASAPEGARFVGVTEGVFLLPKAAGAWTEGALLYWDTANNNIVTAQSATARRVGCAAAAAAADATVGAIRLNGVGTPANVA